MTESPWSHPPPKAPPEAPDIQRQAGVPRLRVALWIAVVAALVGGVWWLSLAYPGAVSTGEDWMWALRGLGFAILISAALLHAGPISWAEKLRHAAIWVAVIVVILLGYSYRRELADVGHRLLGQITGAQPLPAGPNEMVVTRQDSGFFIIGEVNGQRVRFLIDTGATGVVLSPADAERLGVDLASLSFDQPSETANGIGFGARHTLEALTVGPARMRNVEATVNKAEMSSSLLGLSVLSDLKSFRVEGDRLYLQWRPVSRP